MPPCGPQQVSVSGFCNIFPENPAELVLGVGNYAYALHKTVERILPPSVVKDELAAKVEQVESQEGRRVSRSEKADLKDQIVFDLLPQAFKKSTVTPVLFDFARSEILVGCSSQNQAEDVLSSLRSALGGLSAKPASADFSATDEMSRWVVNKSEPLNGYEIGDRCELSGDSGEKVRVTGLAAKTEQTQRYVEDLSMTVVKLEMYDEALAFDLTDTLNLRRVSPLDRLEQNFDGINAENAQAELSARILIEASALRDVFNQIDRHFDGDDV